MLVSGPPSALGKESRCSSLAPPASSAPCLSQILQLDPSASQPPGSSYPTPEPAQTVAGRVPKAKRLTLPSLLSGLPWLPTRFHKQPWPQIQTRWRFHAVPPLWFCLLHCLLLCSLSQMDTLTDPLASALISSLVLDRTDPGSRWPAALSLSAVLAPQTRHSTEFFYCNQGCCSLGHWAPAAYSNSALGAGPPTPSSHVAFTQIPQSQPTALGFIHNALHLVSPRYTMTYFEKIQYKYQWQQIIITTM